MPKQKKRWKRLRQNVDRRQRLRDVLLVKRPLVIIFLVIFFLLLIMVLGNFFSDFFEAIYGEPPTCGDGSFYNTCSLKRPYFCEDGKLLERASICGCIEGFDRKGDSCFSSYHTAPKNITLNYFFDGNKRQIDFAVYGGMVEYLSNLPRTIFYYGGEKPSRVDFKLKHIDEEKQREFLLPLVIEIQNLAKNKEDQMRIATSLVQNIPFGASNETLIVFNNYSMNYSRYPYEVLYYQQGVCGEKSELLAFILREIGYGVVIFYNSLENHESIGIKCLARYSLEDSGYCFVETSGPSIITDNEIDYVGGLKLASKPEIMLISDGISLEKDLKEYTDAESLKSIRKSLKENGRLTEEEKDEFEKLKKKYGLIEVYGV